MKEMEQYIEYIKALRISNPKLKQIRQMALFDLKLAGFKPSKERLEQLIETYRDVYNALLNHSITVVVDFSTVVGHVYIKGLPMYKEESNSFEVQNLGFYPDGYNALYGVGHLKYETEREKKEKFKISKIIELSQEQWEKLGHWVANFIASDKVYSVIAHVISSEDVQHCAKFVDSALKAMGYVNGLMGVFSYNKMSKVPSNIYSVIFSQLPLSSKKRAIAQCSAAQESTYAECEKRVEDQIEILEDNRKLGKKKFINNAIEMLFDIANSLKELITEEPNPEMVEGAAEGIVIGMEMQNNVNAMLGLPKQYPLIPPSASVYAEAKKMMAYSNMVVNMASQVAEQFETTKQNFRDSNKYTKPSPFC
ncbi:MAG: hypothetical protein ABSA84_03275 [Gammaproteobacteria bacterium]|jgi:hypothetical protein